MYTLNRAVEFLFAYLENLEQAVCIQWDNKTKDRLGTKIPSLQETRK